MSNAYYLGIDIGSSFSKAVIIGDERVVSYAVRPSGGDYTAVAETVTAEACGKAGIEPEAIAAAASTGYGNDSVKIANRSYTDITCISTGIHKLFPSVRVAVDIGGQYTRVISLDASGVNTGFLLSDRCAGGSGRFLQTITHVLGISLEEAGALSLRSEKPVRFNTGCAVFAETEAISRIAEGATVEDILAGANNALAARVQTLIERTGIEGDLAVTGGGAKNTGLMKSIGELLKMDILVPEEPQITAAFGAALLAAGSSEL